MRTLEQAFRNAIEIEWAAARFYGQLLEKAADEATRSFLSEMVEQEKAHAGALEQMAARIAELPAYPDDRVFNVEAAPSWASSEGVELNMRDALDIALEAENNAALYYDAMADFSTGEVAKFFTEMARKEEEHAARVAEMLAKLP